ncbi:hypothetical protein GWC95_03600 [Sediminibacterium roseum]|uniref:Uncharacterized protein n=1 Tax=Sediminibacterium roseum TaxID=1978412 RepID=A0ABW9ZPG2_9BACT|nr:hypothetical protein [Sediminibacterium roseum]NCI48991.1 hypothetical protein [Sediminibacterium roseum]
MDFVSKYIPAIKLMTQKYSSVKLVNDDIVITEEQFCDDSLEIIKRFFFYIFKLAIRQFPNYRSDKPEDETFEMGF